MLREMVRSLNELVEVKLFVAVDQRLLGRTIRVRRKTMRDQLRSQGDALALRLPR